MSLHITAKLAEDDLKALLEDLLPLTIDLDPLGADAGQRWFRIERPSHVDFVPGEGLDVRAEAALQWTAAGFNIPVTIHELALRIEPVIASDEDGPKLVFRPTIEKGDLAWVPSFLDRALVSRINAALVAEGDLLGWHFGRTLAQRVALPRNLSPVNALSIQAGQVRLEVQDTCFLLELEVSLGFERQRPDAGSAAS